MIKNLDIFNFRGFEKINISDMSRITLLSGRNNIGKSTILEALFLFMDHTSSDSFARINGFRGSISGGMISFWEPLFYHLDTEREIKICIEESDKCSCVKYRKDKDYLPYIANGIPEDVLANFRQIAKNYYSLLFTYDSDTYHEEGHFFLNGMNVLREIKTSLSGNEIILLPNTRWLNPASIRLSENVLNDIGSIELRGKKGEVISILRQMDQDIEDIMTLSVQGVTQLYLKVKGKLIPAQYAGDGTLKLLQICIAAMEMQNGLLLVDEIETGFHYSMYGKLWSILDEISDATKCQLIATTHSYEMISAVRGNIKREEDFSYYRIGYGKQGHVAHRYNLDMLENALTAEMEVR